ncbi:hypothetical protein [Chromobacterium violaceum]|uniref:hypothetical protein n=1 Tax=Chromobacterium violaceum TaxID=536 RepID=UPI0010550958|nr:hypothetical protein [Chromobacterium violaceum]
MRRRSGKTFNTKRVKILQALDNPRWRYRTASGIAKEIHENEREVEKVLRGNPDLVRISIAKNSDGSALFASRKKVSTISDVWTAFKAVNKKRYG